MCGVEAWNVLSKEYLSDKTKIPTVQTKTGGLHLYFRYNAALPSEIQRVSGAFFGSPEKTVEIDVLLDKKCMIGPGSAGYTFIEGRGYFENAPELPNEIIEILAPVKKEKKDSSEQVVAAELGESGSKAEATSRLVSLQLFKSVVDGIPSSCADNYQGWLRVVWAIADTVAKNGYDALDLADEFSKRSKSTYKGRADVEKVYCQSNGSITFGTLMQLSERKFGGSEDDDIELISDVKVFEELGHATSVKRIVENKDVKVISLELDDAGSDFIGYIRDHVPLFGDDLSAIHPEFGNGPSRCFLKDKDTIEFVYRTEQSGEHRIRVKNPWNSKKSYLTKYSNSKQVGKPVSSKKTLEILIDALETGCHSLLKERYNITIYNNGGDVINNYGTARDEETPVRSESALIQALLAGNPGIVDLFKFCDNGKANNFDGLFVCSSVSGVWK
ncbi:hypothetical protein KI688_010347 [Linnemannia hyalina]|uniref:Primase C-terminal 2 domain-containing protein n=1 Tax=Linnemannia hyalina TaxID=64524 RepID=A0A9P8BV51_9FUNG|nr:hypothetical protein KI688_010347 [Linnemannia hyalina]